MVGLMEVSMDSCGGCAGVAMVLGVWHKGSTHCQKISCNQAINFTSISGGDNSKFLIA